MAKQTINHDETLKPAGGEGKERKSATIDFEDKDKKPGKANWDGFFKRFDCGPERRKRFKRLVSE